MVSRKLVSATIVLLIVAVMVKIALYSEEPDTNDNRIPSVIGSAFEAIKDVGSGAVTGMVTAIKEKISQSDTG